MELTEVFQNNHPMTLLERELSKLDRYLNDPILMEAITNFSDDDKEFVRNTREAYRARNARIFLSGTSSRVSWNTTDLKKLIDYIYKLAQWNSHPILKLLKHVVIGILVGIFIGASVVLGTMSHVSLVLRSLVSILDGKSIIPSVVDFVVGVKGFSAVMGGITDSIIIYLQHVADTKEDRIQDRKDFRTYINQLFGKIRLFKIIGAVVGSGINAVRNAGSRVFRRRQKDSVRQIAVQENKMRLNEVFSVRETLIERELRKIDQYLNNPVLLEAVGGFSDDEKKFVHDVKEIYTSRSMTVVIDGTKRAWRPGDKDDVADVIKTYYSGVQHPLLKLLKYAVIAGFIASFIAGMVISGYLSVITAFIGLIQLVTAGGAQQIIGGFLAIALGIIGIEQVRGILSLTLPEFAQDLIDNKDTIRNDLFEIRRYFAETIGRSRLFKIVAAVVGAGVRAVKSVGRGISSVGRSIGNRFRRTSPTEEDPLGDPGLA